MYGNFLLWKETLYHSITLLPIWTSLQLCNRILNTQYMTNSTLVSPVKMEYGWNFNISGLKMIKFSNENNMVSVWRNFKNIFPRPLFIIIFRPEMLKFYPYSILTGYTRVEFVIYSVLSNSESFKSWGDKNRYSVNMKHLLSFICGVSKTVA